jgi:hypothetical protein
MELQIIIGRKAVLLSTPFPYMPQVIAIPSIKRTLANKNKYQVQVKLTALSGSLVVD